MSERGGEGGREGGKFNCGEREERGIPFTPSVPPFLSISIKT